MRVVLDTNVLISGVFFGGVPGRILDAWRDARIQLVLSAQILDEYQRVGQELGTQYAGVTLEPFLGLLAVAAEFVEAPALSERVGSCFEKESQSGTPPVGLAVQLREETCPWLICRQ